MDTPKNQTNENKEFTRERASLLNEGDRILFWGQNKKNSKDSIKKVKGIRKE